jgi:mediator of RNA polymerase II transcription subunit 31
MTEPSPPSTEPQYVGYTRFELELEVVFPQLGANSTLTSVLIHSSSMPCQSWYLNHLATQKLLQDPSFVAYLNYLQYFSKPEYTKYLTYPGPTLKALQLLQQERFRKDILSPETVGRMVEEVLLRLWAMLRQRRWCLLRIFVGLGLRSGVLALERFQHER